MKGIVILGAAVILLTLFDLREVVNQTDLPSRRRMVIGRARGNPLLPLGTKRENPISSTISQNRSLMVALLLKSNLGDLARPKTMRDRRCQTSR